MGACVSNVPAREGPTGGNIVTRFSPAERPDRQRPAPLQVEIATAGQDNVQQRALGDAAGTAQSAVSSPHTQRKEFPYVMLEVIGRGHFAKVRRCRHKVTGKEYAVKVIDKKRLGSKTAAAFMTEIEILKRIGRHPHIVALEEYFEVRHSVFFYHKSFCPSSQLFEKGPLILLVLFLFFVDGVGMFHRHGTMSWR